MSAEILQLGFPPIESATDSATEVPRPFLTLDTAPDLLSPETLSTLLDGIAVATLAEWRTKDKNKPVDLMVGPVWIKIGGLVRYLKPDVVAWIASLRGSTNHN